MKSHGKLLMTMVAAILLIAAGCGGDDATVTSVELDQAEVDELGPEELGELGVQLEANPDQIEEILAEHGLTLETYEAAIRAITENPGEAKRYAEAYESASGNV